MAFFDWLNENIFQPIGNHLNASWNAISGYGYRTDDEIRAEAQARQNEVLANNQNITKGFEELLDNGASGNDMIKYLLANGDWAKENGDFLNPIIQSQLNRDNLSKDLQAQMSALKENGINPLNVVGDIGSLGTSQLNINPAQVQHTNDENGLNDLKTLLTTILLITKLVA